MKKQSVMERISGTGFEHKVEVNQSINQSNYLK